MCRGLHRGYLPSYTLLFTNLVTTYSTRVRAPTYSADCEPSVYDVTTLNLPAGRGVEADNQRNSQQPKDKIQKNTHTNHLHLTKSQRLKKHNQIKSNKRPLKIATWNVRTLNGPTKLDELCSNARAYNLDAIAITETHLTGQFESKVNGYTFFNSGESSIKRNGVGLLLSPLLADNVASLEQHNSRIITARIYMRHVNLSIVCCYAPTEEASDTAKDTFYRDLNRILNDIPKHDVTILLGDFNAKLTNDNHGAQGILGNHSLHTRTNDNGERFLELCLSHDLMIGSTVFPHKDIHKYTWTHPNGIIKNQIDHVCVSRTWRKSLLDVRTKRNADIGSDHQLVLATFQLKLSRNSRAKPTKRFNTNLLQDDRYTTLYQLEVRNRFHVLPVDDNMDINGQWDRIANTIKEAAESSIGYKKPVKDRWLSGETKDLMKKRTDAGKYRKGRTYHTLCKNVKKSVKKDQDRWYGEQATMMEEARRRNDTRTVVVVF